MVCHAGVLHLVRLSTPGVTQCIVSYPYSHAPFPAELFLQRDTNSLLITQEGIMSEANGVRSRSLSLEIPLIEEAEVPFPLSSSEENNYRYNK